MIHWSPDVFRGRRMRGSGRRSEVVVLVRGCWGEDPLRSIRQFVDAALETLTGEFSLLYSGMGRPSIPPEMLLQAFYSICSERQLMSWLT